MNCWYCGDTFTRMTRDRQTPGSRGGTYLLGNVVPACASCNSSKGAATLDEYRFKLSCKAGTWVTFYGEVHSIDAPAKFWGWQVMSIACDGCGITVEVRRSYWRKELTRMGWTQNWSPVPNDWSNGLFPWMCSMCVNDRIDTVDRALRELDDCYDLGGSC
jgi:HNH endonuclease